MKIRRSSKNIASSPPSIPYSSTTEAFPTPVSGSQSSVCQSPSWEAYERSKQEKKVEKKERKARDEAKATRQPRRLSKPPPARSPYGASQSNPSQSESAIMPNGRKARPASMVIADSPSKDSHFYRQPRSRAGSFSSLLKTLDFRRSSVDQSQERPFIGGIKLEYEQHLANEKAEQSAVDDGDIHPALRKSQSGHGSALKSPPPPPRAVNAKNPNARAYPPNTFRTAQAKSMYLVSPTAPAVPDVSTIDKWRARVGFKPKKSPSSSPSQSPKSEKSASFPRSSTSPNLLSYSPEDHNKGSAEGCARNTTSLNAARKSTPPPEPPRRSSKRNSTLNGSPSMPLLHAALLNVPLATASSSLYDLPSTAGDKQPSASPSWENLQSSVMNTIERTIKPMGAAEMEDEHHTDDDKEEGEKAFWNAHEWAITRSDMPHMTSSSSEDSASDCFNTISMPSTPNTSRPQSEKGLPRLSGESERFTLPRIQLHDNAYPSEACSFVSASSFTGAYDTDREHDPIQAAARKVMAALPPMSTTKPMTEHEPLKLRPRLTENSSMSDSSLTDIARLAPKNPKPQPTKRPTGDTIAKVFVECCGCNFYHDMPSKLYRAMVNPEIVLSPRDQSEFAGALSMTVKCPWCKHAMSTSCCAGLAAMVYVKERLH